MASKHPTTRMGDEPSLSEDATVVGETATEEDESCSSSPSADEIEMRIVPRTQRAPEVVVVSDDTQSDDTADEPPTAAEEAERAASKCAFCSGRKVKACTNLACKRCCLRTDKECSLHSKTAEPKVKREGDGAPMDTAVQSLRKVRKAVLKNEFKESNVLYYDETVTLFCLRDFFHAKKLSQPLLNDQTRRRRATGSATPALELKDPKEPKEQKEPNPGNPELKKKVMAVVGTCDSKRRKVVATH